MNHLKTKQDVINVLKEISQNKFPWWWRFDCGLCSNIRGNIPGWLDEWVYDGFELYFKKWPHYSGSKLFPVPDPDSDESAVDIYFNNFKTGRLYLGKYGELRKNLAGYLAKKFERDI